MFTVVGPIDLTDQTELSFTLNLRELSPYYRLIILQSILHGWRCELPRGR